MRLLPLILLATLASCSVLLDSQYGIRFEPLPRGPRSDAQSIESVSPRVDAVAGVDAVHAPLALAPNAPLATSIDAHAGLASHTDLADLAPEASEPNPAHGATSFAAEGSVETHLEPAPTAPTATLPDADRDEWPTKKPERSMTVAWILWAIPAVLILAEFTGFALMFGAHWYYLGKMRRARTATFIWALTLAVFIVFRVFKALDLSLLAGLVGLVGLLPLLAIMLYRLIADVILLSKISSKQARRALKTSRNRSSTAA